MKIPFSPPYIDDDIRREVLESLDSGWITTGPKVKEFEQTISSEVSLNHTICCNSATSGLYLALHWFGVSKGDEVIIPAYTYAATALVVLHLGATPVMVDVGADFNLDPEQVKLKITSRTKAIIPVDMGGWPCDYQRLLEVIEDSSVCNRFVAATENQKLLGRILMLADAAHSLGSIYSGQPTARASDITVFSFHAVKNVTTAEGGAICLNLPGQFDMNRVHAQMKLWTLNGQTKDALAKTNGGGWRYDIVYPGFKMNMPDLCAAIGLAQLRKYSSHLLPERRRIFQQYISAFSTYEWAEIPRFRDNERESACHIFALRVHGIDEISRDRVIDLITGRGVSVNVHFQPLPMLTLFRELGYSVVNYPVAFDNYSREISLPIYPGLTDEAIDYVIKSVVESYETTVAKNVEEDI